MTFLNSLIPADEILPFEIPFESTRTTWKGSLPIARLLLNLKAVDDRCKLAQNLVGFFVILQLRSDKICEVT